MKLYEVRATVVAYVLAEDEKEARFEGMDAIDHEAMNLTSTDITAQEITNAKPMLAKGWGRGSLVYGAKKEITLGEVLNAVSGVSSNAPIRSPEDSQEASEGNGKAIHSMSKSSEGGQTGR